ncbi:MAG: LamG-like jellyroll fold domain-containing protein [Crocinitomicaceae bacterium]
MKNLTLLFTLLFILSANAQDTISVQTFTYDSISTRRATFDFPSSLQGQSFEKVLLYYNLKCSPLTPWDSYNCGEWDYLTNTTIFEHTGVNDSVQVEGPQLLVNGQDVPTVEYVTTPYYHYYNNYQYFPNYTSQVDNDYSIGSGTMASEAPFGASNAIQHTQLLWTAAELATAGVTAGDIAKLRFDLTSLGSNLNNLSIKMKHTSNATVSGFDETGLTTVYHLNTSFTGIGTQTLNLSSPFNYNGTDNVLIDISFVNSNNATNNVLNAESTNFNSAIIANEKLGYLNIDAGDYVEVDLDDYNFQNEITISFWANGDANFLPANTSVIEGYDSLSQRMLNIHFPWSNSRMYWDAGEGSGYDRIDKAATVAEIEGNWNHWAFTKNQATGEMNIYKNGILWHTGTGLTRTIGSINKFRIGTSGNGNYDYAGKLDEFRVWNTELSQAEISNWMSTKITAAHPNYGNLVLYYDFDNSLVVDDKSVNNRDGMTTANDMLQLHPESPIGFELSTIRPNITFVQGTYTSTLDSILVVDSVLAEAVDIANYTVNGRKFVINNIVHGYLPGYSYTYNHLGVKTDSTLFSASSTQNNSIISYYETPFEVVNEIEIGRFITPYGIGFDLGPNGFTWVYEVSDYQSLLLTDLVDIRAHNTQELIDVRFDFITGTPPRDVKKVETLWKNYGNHQYGNIANDNDLSAISVDLDPTASAYKVKTRITGHGHEGNANCCEWVDKQFSIAVDGAQQYSWSIWQPTECADNPNISQGGTWPYAREGWCPGDKVPEYDFELTPHVTPGSSVNLDYGISAVPGNDQGQSSGNYRISTHLVSYGDPNFSLDASVIDVLNPNDWEYYGKWNPACRNPRIIIKNTGSDTLTSAKITIWVGEHGWQDQSYNWTGSLAFLEEETIEIPIENHFWFEDIEGGLEFHAKISDPNGGLDEYNNNDQYNVTFEAPKLVNGPFYIWLKTNNMAHENKIYLKDVNGDVIWSRESLQNSTDYRDTFDLPNGCYSLELYDSDDDGLSFWYSSQVQGETSGSLRIKRVGGPTAFVADPDFGRYTRFDFTIGYELGFQEANTQSFNFDIFPNPNEGNFKINLDNFIGESVSVQIYSLSGKLIKDLTYGQQNIDGLYTLSIDLENVANGLYFVKVTADEQTAVKQLVVQ